MIRKILLLIIVSVAISGTAFAQKKESAKSREEMRKELREFKIKFMAQEMDLNDEQKQQFAEVYGKMSDERIQLFEQTRALERKLKKETSPSEEDYAKVSKAITEAKEKDAEIEKRYDAQFSKFLTSKQIFKMKGAEEKFRQKMSEMRHNRQKKHDGQKNKSKK